MVNNFSLTDADQKAKAYSGLARYYAAGNDAWLAIHAQIEADLASAAFLLESYNLDVEQVLNEIAEKIDTHTVEGDNAADVMIQIRSIISSSLPHDIIELWEENLTNTEMFNHLQEASSENSEKMAETRMNGTDVENFIASKKEEASSQMEKAREFLSTGDEWDAVITAYASDLAAYEAWLFERSHKLNDSSYTQAEMMWSLAMSSLEKISELPTDIKEATNLVRSRLAWVAGPKEGKELVSVFETI